MMRILLLALLVVTGCARGAPPPPPAGAPGPALSFPSIFALFGDRDRLGLTSEQVTALDSIASWLTTENERLMRELPPEERAAGGRPGVSREPSDETRAVYEQIAGSNARAMTAVEETLSAEQRTRVCELQERQRQPPASAAAGRVREREREARQPPPIAGDSLQARLSAGWRWCARPRPEPDAVSRLDRRPIRLYYLAMDT